MKVTSWPYTEVLADDASFEEWAKGDLTGMRDRVGALGGLLAVSFEAGRGTCVSGTIPLRQ